MRFKKIVGEDIILTLPRKIHYIGLFLTALGIIITITLFIQNNLRISFDIGSDLQLFAFTLSFGFLLGCIIIQIPFLFYLFSSRNVNTGYGHILLFALNITGFIAMNTSIFAFFPVLITGIYFLTHFKTLKINKSTEISYFSERFFLLFFTSKSIPFSEIQEIAFEFKTGLRFLKGATEEHQYHLKLFVFEKDPGLEHIPINTEAEEDSPEFFRPHTLRKTLINKPLLIDSSYFNFNDRELVKFNKLITKLLAITRFTQSDEVKRDKKTIKTFLKEKQRQLNDVKSRE